MREIHLGIKALIALLLGALGTLTFAPFGLFWLAPLVWAGLFYLLLLPQKTAPVRSASTLGFLFGLGFFGTSVSWVYISLHTYGGMPAWLAIIAVGIFCAALAGYHALIAGLFIKLIRRQIHTPLTSALLFASLWGLGDWLRGWLFTGFPWVSLGYSQATTLSPLGGYFPLLGVFGVSVITALIAALALAGRKGWLMLTAIVLGGMGLKTIQWTAPSGEPLTVALLQGNIEQSIKWDPAQYERTLAIYHEMVSTAFNHPSAPKLAILPETAFPSFIDQVPKTYLQTLQRLATQHQADILLGTVTGDHRAYHNTALTLGQSAAQQYHKSHLVPFGETIPNGFQWITDALHIPMSNFRPSATDQAPMLLSGLQVAINICYEDAFGEEIIRALPTANLLVNLSNTAWFGHSAAQPQHLQIARARAMETGRTMLRATNTGMTAMILPNGEVESSLPAFTQDHLIVTAQGYQGTTPYTRWGNLGFLLITASFLINALKPRR